MHYRKFLLTFTIFFFFFGTITIPQAAELAVKFLDQSKGLEVIQVVGPRLVEVEEYNAVSILELKYDVVLRKDIFSLLILLKKRYILLCKT